MNSVSNANQEQEATEIPIVKPKKNKRPLKTKLFLFGMMLIPVLHGICYDLYLKASTIRMMFSDQYGTGFGFYWVSRALSEAVSWNSMTGIAIQNIFGVAIIFNFIGIPIEVVMSYFFMKKIPATKVFRILFYLPTLLSSVVTTLVFNFMFDNTIGPITYAMREWGWNIPMQGLFFAPSTGMLMIYVYIFWLTLGSSTVLITASMLKVPASILESVQLDGASNPTELVRFVVPLISPILSVMFLSNVMAGFSLYTEVILLTDPAQSNIYTVAYLVTEGARTGRYYEAAGRGFVFTVIAIPLVMLTRWFFDRFLPDVSY